MATLINYYSSDLLFTFIGVSGPRIDIGIDFRPVAKLPIDMKSVSQFGSGVHEYGADAGAVSQGTRRPLPTIDLPPGITEVHKL